MILNIELKKLLDERENIKYQILNMETKNFFVIAFVKAMKSKQFKTYMLLKKQLENNEYIDKILLVNKIVKLESYGSVSDYLYLLDNCIDVNKYLRLRMKIAEIDRQIMNFDFKEEVKDQSNMEIIESFLSKNYIEKKAKTLVK